MVAAQTAYPDSLQPALIAPCGMDCGLCRAHLRTKNRCPGCNGDDARKPPHCVSCRIRLCPGIASSASGFCHDCVQFPCARLRQLDGRYRAKYGMSMIANLESIRAIGLEAFVAVERERWSCPGCGGVICVHSEGCVYCGQPRKQALQGPPRPG